MFRFSLVLIIILFLFSIYGCNESEEILIDTYSNENTQSYELGKQFYIKVNQTVTINPGNIKVKLQKVSDDSRCPSDVVCIWAGEVKVVLNITINDQDLDETTLILGAGRDERAIKKVGEYYVGVIAVNPYPVSTRKLEQNDYIVTLMVSKTIDEQAC